MPREKANTFSKRVIRMSLDGRRGRVGGLKASQCGTIVGMWFDLQNSQPLVWCGIVRKACRG